MRGTDNAALATEMAKVPKSDGVVTWNDTALAAIQTQANDALIANNLDHLALTPTVGADMTAELADSTILARIIANGDTSTFVQASDGLRPIATAVDGVPTIAEVEARTIVAADYMTADDVWDEAVEAGYTAREYMRLMAACLFGKTSGGGTGTVTFRDTADGINRIVATVDANKNRTGVVLDDTV
jgi:hypothetical protein